MSDGRWLKEAMALDYEASEGNLPDSYDELDEYTDNMLGKMGLDDPEPNQFAAYRDHLESRMYDNPEEAAMKGMRFGEIADDEPLICLGIVNGLAAFNEQLGDEKFDTEYTVHYNEVLDESGMLKMNIPHISMQIGDTPVMDPGNKYDFNETIEEEQLADMYGLALGVKKFNQNQDIQTSNDRMIKIAEDALERADELGQEDNYITEMADDMIEDAKDAKLGEDEDGDFFVA